MASFPSLLVRLLLAGLCLSLLELRCDAQEFDGLVRNPQELVGKSVLITPERGRTEAGTITEIFQPADDPIAILHFGFKSTRGRNRRFTPDQIRELRIDNRTMDLLPHLPSGGIHLIDVESAESTVDARLKELKRERRTPHDEKAFKELTASALNDIRTAVKKLSIARQVAVMEGERVILVSDYPARQRPEILRFIDGFIPKLNEIFGFDEDAHVLPGKPIVALFATRENLGVFQRDVVGNPSYGSIRAFFHIVDGHVVVTAEDDRSPKHAVWQVAWGLSGAYAVFSYSSVVLPAWIRVGVQQHSADLLVPALSEPDHERKRVLQEINGGSLNGLFIAENLPLDRQVVCKLVVAHLYKLSPTAFGQTIHLLKNGLDTNEALSISYGLSDQQTAQSFGAAMGIPQLTP